MVKRRDLLDIRNVLQHEHSSACVIGLHRRLKGIEAVSRIDHQHTVTWEIRQFPSHSQGDNRCHIRVREEVRIEIDGCNGARIEAVRMTRRSRDTCRSRYTRRSRVTRSSRCTINTRQVHRVGQVGKRKGTRDVLEAAYRYAARVRIIRRDNTLKARLCQNRAVRRRNEDASCASVSSYCISHTTATTRTRVDNCVLSWTRNAAISTHNDR